MASEIIIADTTTIVAHWPTLVMNLSMIPASITHGKESKKFNRLDFKR